MRKGIILAGGLGTRLFPLTIAVSKQLLPVYDKPLIYYPLSALILAGVQEVLFITTPQHRPAFEALLGDGSRWGMRFVFEEQDQPRGLADAYRIARIFLNGSPSVLILGDNIFHGHGLTQRLAEASARAKSTVFASFVREPERFGIVELDADGNPISIEEKPSKPRSNLALTGLYFLDERACDFADEVTCSERGEIEITSVLEAYMNTNQLHVEVLNRGFAWLDAGTTHSIQQASEFVQALQERQGLLICSPEELAYRQGLITLKQFADLADELLPSSYGEALCETVKQE